MPRIAVQTFLPYRSFERSAAALDVRRLGKQRVETLQILRAVTFEDYGWRNHPAVTMWVGYTEALVAYGAAVARRWQSSGFSDTVLPQLLEFLAGERLRTQRDLAAAGALPPWLGVRALHRSHQAALVRKDPEHYGPLFPSVDPELPYVWPESAPPLPPTSPVSAWVVRVDPVVLPAALHEGIVGLAAAGDEAPAAPAGTSTRDTKRRRQLRAFVEQIEPGDPVVVPDGDVLHLGAVGGGYQWRSRGPAQLRHVREVTWRGALPRSALRRPAFLQDPRVVFPLRDEPLR